MLDRSTRRVVHQSASLEGARGFSEARDEPTSIAMLAEYGGQVPWSYRLQAVNAETGEVLMESEGIDFDDASDLLFSVKLVLVPSCLARKEKRP